MVSQTGNAWLKALLTWSPAGKRLHLRHLSPDCLEVLENAKGMIEVNVLEDPHYHMADNKLG